MDEHIVIENLSFKLKNVLMKNKKNTLVINAKAKVRLRK